MSAANAPYPLELPAPQLLSLQAVFRFATIGRGDPALDDALYEAVRAHFPFRLLQRPASDPGPQSPHLVFSSQTAQMAVGLIQSDVVMQLGQAGPAALTELAGGLLESVRLGLIAGGLAPTTMGLITTMQTSTHNLENFSPQEHIFGSHMRIADVDPDRVQDVSVALNLKIADRYFVGVNLSAYESRQIVQPVLPGVAALPMLMNPWDGVLTDTGVQLRVDVNNQLEQRLNPGNPALVSQDVLSDVLQLSQTVADDLAQSFISDGTLPIAALEGALNQ